MYRRLPLSDAQRSAALRSLKEKADSQPEGTIPFSEASYTRLNTFYPIWKKEIEEKKIALGIESESNKQSVEAMYECKMYVSHFFQVYNLGVDRGKFSAADRTYFLINPGSGTVPDLSSEEKIKTAAQNIITGDPKRVAAGGAEMTNPSRAEVETVYNIFSAKSVELSNKKDISEKESQDVVAIRAEADDLIKDIWDEIEFTYRKDELPVLRRKAREYGVVYVSRSGEPDDEVPPSPNPGPTPA